MDNVAKELHKVKCEKYKSGLEYAAVIDSTPTFKCYIQYNLMRAWWEDSKKHIAFAMDKLTNFL